MRKKDEGNSLIESAKRAVLRRMMRKAVLGAAGFKELSAALKVLCDADKIFSTKMDGEESSGGLPLWEESIDSLIKRHKIVVGETDES